MMYDAHNVFERPSHVEIEVHGLVDVHNSHRAA